MSGHSQFLDSETFTLVADALADIGVAGNEGDRRFDTNTMAASLPDLEEWLRRKGSHKANLTLGGLARPNNEVDVIVYDSTRFDSVEQAEEAWASEYRQRCHDRVECRVEDWVNRLDHLRTSIAEWLAASDLHHLSFVEQSPYAMSEGLMTQFNVSPRLIRTFDLRDEERPVLRFRPKGLWIIGANGRVDLVTRKAAPILIDRSKPLTKPSEWHLFDQKNGRGSIPFTSQSFFDLIRAGLQ